LYRSSRNAEWSQIELTPQEYFDPDLDKPLDIDSVPRHDHALAYLNAESSKQITLTRMIVENRSQQKQREIATTYWNEGKNWAAEVKEIHNGNLAYWELILNTLVSDNPEVWEVLRLGREDGLLTVYSHSVIERRSDGSELDNPIPH
jgi:hypothetical protein